ncbi:MAG: hypothetical protein H6567_06240 [Lewinellaceae bacterium]|nr:hypothetical protein [Lewinellaceae bacterium]
MLRNVKLISLLLTFFMIGCVKNDENCPYFFTLPVSISPAQEVYHIGDTIRIVSEFEDQVMGSNGVGKELGTFDMQGIMWQPTLSFFKLDTIIPNKADHKSLFDGFANIEILKGNLESYKFSTGDERIIGEYLEDNHTFSYSINIIPRKKGVFFISFLSFVNFTPPYNLQDFPGRCDRSFYDIHFKTNGGTDNHYHLMLESPDPYWNRTGVGNNIYSFQFDQVGGYCFRVE